METTRFVPVENDCEPINSEEFEAGYFARLAGETQCLSATRGWRAGWADADAGSSIALAKPV
jgi:hypothetical protein